MFLLSMAGERHEDHIPLYLCETKESLKTLLDREYPEYRKVYHWDEDYVAFHDGMKRTPDFSHWILPVTFDKRIKET